MTDHHKPSYDSQVNAKDVQAVRAPEISDIAKSKTIKTDIYKYDL